MIELRSERFDLLIEASLERVIENDANAFLQIDTSEIKDNPKLKRRVLNIAASDEPLISRRSPIRIALIACLLAIAVMFTACMCMPKVREAIWDTIVQWYNDHISVTFRSNEENTNNTNDTNEINTENSEPNIINKPSTILNKAEPTYLPMGYYGVENESTLMLVDTFYYDSEDNIKFRLLQSVFYTDDDIQTLIDNENDPIFTININGYEGILVEYTDTPGLYYLVWQDNSYRYSLYGSFSSREELTKIAQGIKF